jgi:hypothetical protein
MRPLLIVAQSGQFLAQSATQAGYSAWVADCFGDTDTLAVSERWQKLDDLHSLSLASFLSTLEALTQGEPCYLIYGSGIEHCYEFINHLPKHIEILGNHTKTYQYPFTIFHSFNRT